MKFTRFLDSSAAVACIVFLVYGSYSVAGCGGSSGSSNPSAPSSGSGTSGVTVNIVSSAGNGAFSPNPIQAASGTMVTWKNNTSETHHLVMDDGSVIGDIPPGGSSTPLPSKSVNYHCTTHPSMVGSINGAVAPTPPPGSGDGY